MINKRTGLLIAAAIISGFTSLHAQKQQRGKASYYSKKATGARTSSGERIHHDSLTCAHRTYPFGTKLKVTNPGNGKSVTVKVTDRGPFGRGRIIDLSWCAAKELGILSQGVAMVVVERADKIVIPFRPDDDKKLTELDFESGNMAHRREADLCVRPSWHELKEANRRPEGKKLGKRQGKARTRPLPEGRPKQDKQTPHAPSRTNGTQKAIK